MSELTKSLRHSLVLKLILTVGITLLLTISGWAYFNIKYQKKKMMENVAAGADKLSNTIKLGTHYAMMSNSGDDINQIINNIARQQDIENIRIYNKNGQIKFSSRTLEVDRTTNIKAEACDICHRTDPPLVALDLAERTRIFYSPAGYRLLGIISPIYNEPSCSADACHVHPEGKKILGALDVVVSLEETDKEIFNSEKGMIVLALFAFLLTSGIIFIFVIEFVNRPIRKLINGTRLIAKGEYSINPEVKEGDELGQLASAINRMGREIGEKQGELNKQRDEYQNLFELVPCIVTVQDRNYRLVRYNREFAEKFDPVPGDYCFRAYKGRDEKCVDCPVEKTFEDGMPHYSEESGFNKEGKLTHWLVTTSPIRNDKGEIIAAMEMNLDITRRKQLEEKLEISEKKYYAIFNNIPNPVFVLDMDTLKVVDCNESVNTVYEYSKDQIIRRPFLDIFKDEERDMYDSKIKTSSVINQVRHITRQGKTIFVNIRVSPSEYPGQKVLLVTTSDITSRLEAEQQLIQASKMATLGEMATGVAHELNQPLSVIKIASSFFMKKIRKNEKIRDEILFTMSQEIDSHVDRATKIINHMREFGRKSDMTLGKIQVNEVLKKAFEIFSQQLKLREIEVTWDIEESLPLITADAGRLEQVFINLLINARDAIDEKWKTQAHQKGDKKITLKTGSDEKTVFVEVSDTGTGIPDDIAEKVFEPFFTTKKVGEGTGLGLSISYGIINDCGGAIQVAPNKTDGTCFIIQFPIQDED